MSSTASASRRNDPEAHGDDAARTEFAEVHLDEKDPTKTIERRQDQALPPSEDADGGDAHLSFREREWLDRNKAVAKRIGRMNRQFNQRLAEIEAERQRERADWRRELDALKTNRTQPAVDEAKHNAEMTELERQLEAAHEAGNSKEVVRLTRQMSQKDAAFLAAKQAALLGTDVSRREEDRRDTRADGDSPPRQRANGQGHKWTQSQDWWDDPEFAPERAAAIAIDRLLIDEEDSDPTSKEHYIELSKRLRKKFPDLDVVAPKGKKRAQDDDDEEEDDIEGDEEETPSRRKTTMKRPPVPAFNDRGQASKVRRGERGRSVSLSKEDQAEMRRWKLDPENDADVQEWARSIAETESAYGGR